jgi:hypothetical protein
MENPMNQRHDMYSNVHKGLRRALCTLLSQAGTTGPSVEDRQLVRSRWQQIQTLLSAHHHHEDLFIGPHLHRLAPDLLAIVERDHARLHAESSEVGAAADAFAVAETVDIAVQEQRFYRQLAVFVSHYFAHMADEETHCVSVLQAAYADAELAAIEGALVASIEPGMMASFCAEMFPALTARECFMLLDDARRNAPAPAFEGMSQLASSLVNADSWRVVQQRLAEASASAIQR